MVILHIALIGNSLFDGVSVSVPAHIKAQKQYAEVALWNVSGETIQGVDTQFSYVTCPSIERLPNPFCKPDLVVFHEVYRVAYVKIQRELKKKKIPYVILPHGSFTVEAQKKKRLKKMVANFSVFSSYIKSAIAVQCLSEKEMAFSKCVKRKFVATNGMELPQIQKNSFSDDGVNILYIGRLEKHIKGLDLMLEAIKTKADFLRKNHVKINLFGPDSGCSEELKTMINERGLDDFVTLNDAISGVDKENQIMNADIFFQTSRTEGMSMGIVEALGYGVPCLVTRGTNLGEIIEENDAGWVAETNVISIADKLEKAVSERNLWPEKSKNARILVETHFSWEKVSQMAVETYENLINSN